MITLKIGLVASEIGENFNKAKILTSYYPLDIFDFFISEIYHCASFKSR